MSEYIEIEVETGDDPAGITFFTNLPLAAGAGEQYTSQAELEEGSPVAQALAPIAGLRQVTLEGRDLIVVRDLDAPLHVVVAEVSAALKDFFL